MANFVSALKSLLQKSAPVPAEEGRREHRVYQRFNLGHSSLFFAELPSGESVPILNLSFGGLGLQGAPTDTDDFPIVIRFLDKSIPASVHVTHRGTNFVGNRFEPREPQVIAFLQPLLEAIGQGLSMRTIDAAALKDETRNAYEWVLRGEGPSDLLVSSSSDPCAHLVLTFRSGKDYLELSIKDNVLNTAKAIDNQGRAARMSRDTTPDKRVVDLALLILTGAMEQVSLLEVLKPAVVHLRKSREFIQP